ncbi:cytochrome P450 [Streptomyces sp. PU-14G]|uniref:cytochrome P450 n=1 Tax=Streptomyces sp. PU-14G TaxID=2800808 RepID=UPI0034DFF6BF
MRARRPLIRVRLADGNPCWLASGYRTVRAVLSDRRFSSRYELLRLPQLASSATPLSPATMGDLTGIDPPDHTRYRRLLAGKFTVRRMRTLTARAEEITTEHLDIMERRGGPVDLVTAFAQPVPILMICELLGVPHSARDAFRRHAALLAAEGADLDDQRAALDALNSLIADLLAAKRTHPTDDLLSDLLTGTDLSGEELAGIGGFLLAAGLHTTSAMLGLGTFALLSHPAQAAALRADPGLSDSAVDELLRYLSIAHTAARSALEDVEVDGQVIRAGETVLLSVEAANRDPLRFDRPDTLDIRRKPVGHLAFGHGIHQCLGQQLARVELGVAYSGLLSRFPTLRLAVPPKDVPLRVSLDLYGVRELPVTWQ